VIVLSSTCAEVGGCHVGSRQWLWLRRDLARHRSSRLSAAGSDVVLAGHDHHYGRFAPISGVRSFIVGTGGRGVRPFVRIHPKSVARQAESFGVLHS
jgi:hypothetical protein